VVHEVPGQCSQRTSLQILHISEQSVEGSEADHKLDIFLSFLTPAGAVLLDGEHDWSNVLVIGEHKQNPVGPKSECRKFIVNCCILNGNLF